jgi:hypothetical protein
MRIRQRKISEKTIRGYKTFIFKAMKNIVDKNIFNCINLLKGTSCRNIPEYDEILSECYIIFDKCIEKYDVTPTNSFYFYFNKALSRNFYRMYQRELNSSNVELSNEIMNLNSSLSISANVETLDLLFYNLNLNEFEKKICLSKVNGERSNDFLKKNKKISQKKYSETLIKIKKMLNQLIEGGKYD